MTRMATLGRRSVILGGALLGVVAACTSSPSPDPDDGPPTPRGPQIDLLTLGVVGDGKTDDSVALQRAVDDLARRGGGTLVVPSGATVVVRSLRLRGGVAIVGRGGGAGLRKLGNSAKWISCAAGSDSVILAGLRLECPTLARTAMIEVSSRVKGFVLDSCQVVNTSGRRTTGLETREGVTDVRVVRCAFVGQSAAIKINKDPKGVLIESCTFEDWTQRAIQVLGSAGLAASDIRIAQSSIGPNVGRASVRQPIQFNGVSASPFRRVSIVDNSLTGRATAHADPRSPGTADMISLHECHDFEILRNTCTNGGEVGITVARQCRDGVIADNTITSCDSAGIAVGSGTTQEVRGIEVRGNVLMNNGLDRMRAGRPGWARAGVVVYRATSVSVKDNTIKNHGAVHAQDYGVTVTDSDEVTVVNNTTSGLAKSPVLRRSRKQGEKSI